MERVILHCDLNNFYASVECMKHPELKDKYVAVSGNAEERHGIILAKNEKAKKLGIKTGETIWQAKLKCPDLILLKANFHEYLAISKKIKRLYSEYSDRIESFGLDEAWIDCSESVALFGSGEEIAEQIRSRVKKEFDLTISIGVSFNKIYAKLGSDYKKPDAVTCFNKKNYKEKIFPLPVSDLLYVGKATEKKFREMGITTIGDLATSNKRLLSIRLGKMGEILHDFANGIDHSEVALFDNHTKLKSIGNGITAKRDMENLDDAILVLYVLCDSIAMRLRQNRKLGKCVSVHFRNKELISFSRQMTLNEESNLCEEIVKAAIELTKVHYNFDIAMRSITVSVSQLIDEGTHRQLSLFNNRDKIESIERCMDEIRAKFGISSIFRANSLMDVELTSFSPIEDHVIFPQSYF